ncbi:MAG: DUF6476 family protein [Pseudomonadota bacterium]
MSSSIGPETSGGTDAPAEPAQLRLLRRLVTVLTSVMIVAVVTAVILLVIRLGPGADAPPVPDSITLPEGETAEATTIGRGWIAVVTVDRAGQERIRIHHALTGAPLQTVEIARPE